MSVIFKMCKAYLPNLVLAIISISLLIMTYHGLSRKQKNINVHLILAFLNLFGSPLPAPNTNWSTSTLQSLAIMHPSSCLDLLIPLLKQPRIGKKCQRFRKQTSSFDKCLLIVSLFMSYFTSIVTIL